MWVIDYGESQILYNPRHFYLWVFKKFICKRYFFTERNIISSKFELIFLVFFVLRIFTFYAIWKMDCFSKYLEDWTFHYAIIKLFSIHYQVLILCSYFLLKLFIFHKFTSLFVKWPLPWKIFYRLSLPRSPFQIRIRGTSLFINLILTKVSILVQLIILNLVTGNGNILRSLIILKGQLTKMFFVFFDFQPKWYFVWFLVSDFKSITFFDKA